MSDSYSNPERPRPSYGMPAPESAPASGSSSVSGQERPAPTYGQPSAPSATPEPAAQQHPSYGQPSTPSAPANGAPSQSWNGQQSAPSQGSDTAYAAPQQQSSDPFGGYGVPQHGGNSQPSGPLKKQKPIGIILTVLGALTMLASLVVMGFSGTQMFNGDLGGLMPPESPNSTHSGTTATYEFSAQKDSMFMIWVPDADSKAACTAKYSDGSSLEMSSSGQNNTTIPLGGKDYRAYREAAMTTKDGSGTITCTDVSSPVVVQGPINANALGKGVLGILAGIAIGVLGFLLFIAGIVTMLVRASRRKRAQA